jgi:hypothetical protein
MTSQSTTAPPWRPHHHDDEKRAAAVAYVLLGSYYAAAREVGVPYTTVKNWARHPWWAEMVSNLRSEHDDEISAKVSQILSKALDNLLDRMEHGDIVVNAKGEPIGRKPLKAIEICRVLESASRIKARMREVDEVVRGRRRVDEIADILRARGALRAQPAEVQ